VRRRLPNIRLAALAASLTSLWLALMGCTIPPDDAAGSVRLNRATELDLPPFDEAESVLADMEKLGLSPVQRQAVDDLQAAMRQIDTRLHVIHHWPMIVLKVTAPADLRAGPSFQAPKIADLNVGGHVVTFTPFSTWVEIQTITFPAHHSLLHREPGPPIDWRGSGFMHQDRIEYDDAAQSRFDSEVFLSALAAFQESFVSADSSECLDDLQVCKQRSSSFDCELITIVCIGEAFTGDLG
jgi:hypothetical protein